MLSLIQHLQENENLTFMNANVHIVDHETFCKCVNGKKLGDRWFKYIDDESLCDTLKKDFYKNKRVILQSNLTNGMVFLRQS